MYDPDGGPKECDVFIQTASLAIHIFPSVHMRKVKKSEGNYHIILRTTRVVAILFLKKLITQMDDQQVLPFNR